MKKSYIVIVLLLIFVFLLVSCNKHKPSEAVIEPTPTPEGIVHTTGPFNTSTPSATVKLMFIHHSTGSAWIATGNGNLGQQLNNNNYYVTEADYGWTASLGTGCTALDPLGSYTDTGHWPCWFTDTTMPDVYANSSHYDYTDSISDPGGENEIIMFKSCYPNSEVGASIDDEKAIYNSLLAYFAAHTDKLFILVIPPPEIEISSAALTRKISQWLVDRENGWLSSYVHSNVYAFNYYNVLTDPNNHHRMNGQYEENIVTGSPVDAANPDELYYPSAAGNNHPSSTGHQKATAEFIPLLNAWYNNWKGI